jgi:hypothetical protein
MPPRLEQASTADAPAVVAIEATPAHAGTIGIWPLAAILRRDWLAGRLTES